MPSKFKERLPNLYKDHGIADLTMGLYTKDANLDSVWNDISQEPLEFAQKYIGKDFMQEMRETSKGGYLYVIRLVKEFLKVFSDIENVMKESESVEITDMIDRIMKLGRNIGFKDSLIHELTMSSIPTPGTSKTTDPFISLKAFAYLFTLLPLEWSHMRKEYFLFPGGSVLYETVICRLIWITLHCIVDSIRFHFEIKIDKNNVIKAISSKNPALRPKKLPKMDIPIVEQRQPLLQTPQIKTSDVPPNISLTTFPSKSKSNPNPTIFNTIPKTQHIYAESFLQVSKKEFCRTSSNNSLIYSLINDANPNINLIIHPDLATMLPSATKIFFENYLQKIAAKLKNTISCGEVKYLTEKTMNITKKPYIFEMNENVNIRFHQKLGTLVHMLARTILNTEEFEAAPEMFEIFAPIFTVGRSEYIFSTNKTTSIFSHG
ncbi:unnamed protein product [Caenorhabditis angaria]|uniref:Uncharacterized protein n=1 Tax=Caenorhabditis angaria TaxID=860376 RepID=A0A9P1IK32_9PELO|nr:unnamed protein product [Caenorhabditis angaria]